MLDWLFGSKKEEKKPEEPIKKEDELSKDEVWIYDYVKQYLTSPLWSNPLLDFMEQNCLIFEDVEENKFQYTKVFQEFTGLTALLLQSMIEEVGITEKVLEKCIIRGMRSHKDAKIFGQVLICDNFLAFKKHMVAKNKELEIEAMKDLNKKTNNKAEANQIQIDTKELQRLELEKAIAMSMAVSGKTQQEKQLEEAIRLSQVQYQKEEEKRVAQKQKVEEKPSPKKQLLGPLPPLSSVKPPRPVQEYKEQEVKLKEEIEVMKKEEEIRRVKQKDDQENEQARKKRLLEQRQLIRKKKQEERKEDLQNFMQAKNTTSSSNLSEEQLERRRNLMKRLKQTLKE